MSSASHGPIWVVAMPNLEIDQYEFTEVALAVFPIFGARRYWAKPLASTSIAKELERLTFDNHLGSSPGLEVVPGGSSGSMSSMFMSTRSRRIQRTPCEV